MGRKEKNKERKRERIADAERRLKIASDPSMRMFSAGLSSNPKKKTVSKFERVKANAKLILSAFETNRSDIEKLGRRGEVHFQFII